MNIAKFFKRPFYKIVRYILHSDFFRKELWYALNDILRDTPISNKLNYYPNPYFSTENNLDIINIKKPIFITGRFRSGSTFLWLIFRNIPNITSYYEPLNENKWFLPKKFKVDPSHIGVSDYWAEYQGFDFLKVYFKEEWSYKKLYMTEKDYDPNLYRYIQALIENSKGRPVLQFNRIDFRLPWFKTYFPNVPIIHIIRNPREQWMSIQRDGGPVSPDFIIKSENIPSLFYTIAWANDLKKVFPFLEPIGKHPYVLHYFLWMLSYIFGKTFADYHIFYESLVLDFKNSITKLFNFLSIQYSDEIISNLEKLNKGKISEKWKDYASIKWFEEKEKECEIVLKAFFSKL
ncbi:sulfotransferase [Thermodesulfatator atlanticus]|uniref:sulfotransferase n=1 Tax=Thermodesulfatator atlanticus TaxID=501497 RepID=UPI0003B38F18|nr:sulfotransferase [Thermodesulfatator atlanticus]